MTEPYTEALLYCRVSSTRQRTNGGGLDSQEHRCRIYAAEHGYTVAGIFPDDITGTGDFMKRPGMVELVKHLKKNKDTNYVVIFDDLKRLARDTISHLQLRMLMRQYDARVECPNFKFDDTPEGEFIETILAAQGQLEAKQGQRQTIQKMKARLEAGYWVFCKPIGYKYERAKGGGRILIRNEPLASIITEALEGFASGRFQSKAEVKYFLETVPEYPKGSDGKVHWQRVEELLTRIVYAGYVEHSPWNVSLRRGHHAPLISLETFNKIQDNLKGRRNVPARKDLNKDFPLRGAVVCADCDKPMTACWSKGKTKLHPYYYCKTKGCVSRSKTIRKEIIEGEFEALLKTLRPIEELIVTAKKIFESAWNQRGVHQKHFKKSLQDEFQKLERQASQLLDRILDTEVPSVVKAYEQKIKRIEEEKLKVSDKLSHCGKPVRPHDEMLRTSIEFLSNPCKLWASERLEDRRAVLKLAFLGKLAYRKNEGFRTPKISLPFKWLGDFETSNFGMAPSAGVEPAIFPLGGDCIIHYATRA